MVSAWMGAHLRTFDVGDQLPVQVIFCRRWYAETGHSVSHPTGSEVADYLLWLWESRKLSVSSVKAHCSMLSAVFRFKLLELGGHHVLRDLIRYFAIEHPLRPQLPSSWDLVLLGHRALCYAFSFLTCHL